VVSWSGVKLHLRTQWEKKCNAGAKEKYWRRNGMQEVKKNTGEGMECRR
jgi:hypothetical protein